MGELEELRDAYAKLSASHDELEDALAALREEVKELHQAAEAHMLQAMKNGQKALAAREERDRQSAGRQDALKTIAALRDERDRLREALEWYAGDGSTYDGIDVGQRARAALAATGEEENADA